MARTEKRKMKLAGSHSDPRASEAILKEAANPLSGFVMRLSYGLFGDPNVVGPSLAVSNLVPVYDAESGPDDLLVPDDPVLLRRLYTYFYEHDEIVGQAIDIHTEVPLSRIVLLPPKVRTDTGDKMLPTIMLFFDELVKKLDLFEYLIRLTHQYWLYGEAFPYHEVNEGRGSIDRIYLIDPDLIATERSTLGGDLEVYLDFSNVQGIQEEGQEITHGYLDMLEDMVAEAFGQEALQEYQENKRVRLNTDPAQGSFVYPFLRTRSTDSVRGSSILHRVLRTLIYRDQIRSTQALFMQRNMMSVHLVSVDPGEGGVTDDDISELQTLVDRGINTPDFSIVTDRAITWDIVRGYDRVPDFTTEYDQTTERLMIGLGLTPELLKGEGLYSSGRISLEILNLRYQLYIAQVKKYVEEILFRPISVRKEFKEVLHTDGGDTLPIVLYPRVSFSRTTLYDSESAFEMMWNLYLQGVVSLHRVMDIMSIDFDIEMDLLTEEFGTQASPVFRDTVSSMANILAEKFVNNTDILNLIVSKLKDQGIDINIKEEETEQEGPGGFMPGPGGFEEPSESPLFTPPQEEGPGLVGPGEETEEETSPEVSESEEKEEGIEEIPLEETEEEEEGEEEKEEGEIIEEIPLEETEENE